MERTAKIIQVLPEQRGNGSKGEWVKNAFVVEWTDNGYTQKLCLEVMGSEKWEKMKKAVVVGNEVLVKYEATSREYNGKYYTTAACWYCANVGAVNNQPQQSQQQHIPSPAPQTKIPQDGTHVEDDGLPF